MMVHADNLAMSEGIRIRSLSSSSSVLCYKDIKVTLANETITKITTMATRKINK